MNPQTTNAEMKPIGPSPDPPEILFPLMKCISESFGKKTTVSDGDEGKCRVVDTLLRAKGIKRYHLLLNTHQTSLAIIGNCRNLRTCRLQLL